MKGSVAVAMSGGVDSSLAAVLLKDQGWDIVGVTLRLWSEEEHGWEEAVASARSVARWLGAPHVVVDASDMFRCCIVHNFIDEYTRGRTPNPCVICNPTVKFGFLWRRIQQEVEVSMMATGHYARKRYCPRRGRFLLCRGFDLDKDQSYVLYRLTQDQLARSLFPLGDMSKAEVQERAVALGMPLRERQESQDICFLFGKDYRRFLRRHASGSIAAGPILDEQGEILGEHEGLAFYTVGQRRGLGVSAPHPLYVLRLDRTRNAIIVGPRESLIVEGALLCNVNFFPYSQLQAPQNVEVKIRYNARGVRARLMPSASGSQEAEVRFEEGQPAVTPGQSAVCYQDDLVVGGGIITDPISSLE